MKLPRVRLRPNIQRIVFWVALVVMLSAAATGLVWRLIAGHWGQGPLICLTIGIEALLVAVVFRLLELANPMFHPESHLFSWDDVDALRLLSRRHQDGDTREWARSLADRIAVVLPGRPTPPQPKSRSVR